MKFLLIVLAIHFMAELIIGKQNKNEEEVVDERNEFIRHPAEFILRR